MGYLVARKTGQRLRSGIQTVGAVDSSYAIESLAVQSDQFDIILWSINASKSQVLSYARQSSNGDGSKSDDGFANWAWAIDFMTFGMVSYWNTRFGLTTARSANVTAMTYDENDTAVFLTAKIYKPVFGGSDAPYAIGGYGPVIWRFGVGIVIT